MANDYLEKRYTCIYKSIEKGCLHCKSQHPCPPLIVIAMQYSREIAELPPQRSDVHHRSVTR
jgi:hypothetical protein